MHCSFLIPHPNERQILIVAHSDGLRLPNWTLPSTWADHPAHEHQRALLLNQAVREQFGLATAVLLMLSLKVERLVIFDTLHFSGPSQQPMRWIGSEELAFCTFANPDHRAILEAWFAEEETPQRMHMPWQRRGWFAETATWIAAQLERIGWSVQSPVEQLYTKYGACMLRASTTGGTVYLKALPPSFGREPRLVAHLMQHFPRQGPHALAIDEARNLLLMQETPGTLLYDLVDMHAWEHALSTFAELQVDSVRQREELLAAGCPDLRLSVMDTQLEPMLSNRVALHIDQPGGLSSGQVAHLRARVPDLQAASQRLAEYGIPETLEHGDFNPMNILVQDERITYLDWTDASLTHPFFSALRLLTYFLPASLKERHPDLRAAYLEPWTIYAPMKRLLQALEHATTPMLLHRALNYYLLDFTQQNISWERSTVVARQLQALIGKA